MVREAVRVSAGDSPRRDGRGRGDIGQRSALLFQGPVRVGMVKRRTKRGAELFQRPGRPSPRTVASILAVCGMTQDKRGHRNNSALFRRRRYPAMNQPICIAGVPSAPTLPQLMATPGKPSAYCDPATIHPKIGG